MPVDLLLTAPYTIDLALYEERPLAEDEVRATAMLSAISHGTEISLYRGTSPFHERRFDGQQRLFLPQEEAPAYPARLGYEWVGRVSAAGAVTGGYAPGDLVHLPLPHRETQTFQPAALAPLGVSGPLPAAVSPEQAVFLGSTSIALQAVHDARLNLGDEVIVFGLGILGLLTVQLCLLNGAGRIIAVDPVAGRRALALTYGADAALDPLAQDVGTAVKPGAPGPDVAIEFSGNYAALQQAIRSVRMGGLVVAAGFYQGEAAALNLGEEWLHNRVSMVASMRGWGNAHRDAPRWDRARLRATAIDLHRKGALSVTEMITHRVPFLDAARAYALIDAPPPDLLKVVLRYD